MPSFDSIDRFVAQGAPFLTDGEEWWLRSQEKSSKFQTPSSKEAPSSKPDLRAVYPGICFWGLMF